MHLLSTKILQHAFKIRVLALGYQLVEYPFIAKKAIAYAPQQWFNNWIFSSSLGAKTAVEHPEILKALEGKHIYCVGKKTAEVFQKENCTVVAIENSAQDLAQKIIASNEKEGFSFFCGTKRRPEIETLLLKNNIQLNVHELYSTTLTPKKITSPFEAALFFSPSAVESFAQKNTFDGVHAFCIGPTTATSVAAYTQNYSTAKTPEEGSLLVQLKKHITTC